MTKSMMEKIEDAMRELEIARKWVYHLGEGDEEPSRTLHRRTMALDAHAAPGDKPTLIVRRIAPPAKSEEERAERKRERDAVAYEKRKARIAAGLAPKPKPTKRMFNHARGREIVLKIFLDAHNKPMRSGDVIDRWPGKVVLMGKQRQQAYQPLHEMKKLGLVRHNTEDGFYALSEAGLRMAQSLQPGG